MISPVFLGSFDVPVLRALVATTQEDDNFTPCSTKVHPVTRTRVDAKLKHTVSDWPGISEIANPNSCQSLANTVAGRSISMASKPLGEWFAPVGSDIDRYCLLNRHFGSVA